MTIVTYCVQLQAIRKAHIMRAGEEPEFIQPINVDVDDHDPNRYAVIEKKSFLFFFNIYDESQFESVTIVSAEIVGYGIETPAKTRNSKTQGAKAQKHGADGQERGAAVMCRMGILQLHQVATPYIRIAHPKLHNYYRIIEKEKVPGDWVGLLPNGVGVLAEIKTRFDANLAWSDFEPHQPGALTAHASIAVALLVYVHNNGINVMRWPVSGFDRPRCSISPARAAELDIQFQPIENLMRR